MPRTRVLGAVVAATLASSLAFGATQPSEADAAVARAKLADRAKNAQRVRGIGASRRPRPGMLLPLGRGGRFPASVLTNIVDSSLLQRPLTRVCPRGQSIRAITRMGSVSCQVTGDVVPPLVFDVGSTLPLFHMTNTGTGSAIEGESRSTLASAYFRNLGAGSGLRADSVGGSKGAVSAFHFGTGGYGLWAELLNPGNPNAAIYARTAGGGRAIDAEVNSTTSTADALFARSRSTHPDSYAGYFSGDVRVTGNLAVGGTVSKAGGAFRINHPLSPATRYLQHSFVESPDMKNIYDGVTRTDGRGFATVRLPRWFQALNGKFRYQLTTIRSFAKAIVWREVRDNSFVIRTQRPHVKVSWQVTGIRHDAYAKANRIEVDVPKRR
jgi:hypothetical protein